MTEDIIDNIRWNGAGLVPAPAQQYDGGTWTEDGEMSNSPGTVYNKLQITDTGLQMKFQVFCRYNT